MEPTVNVDKTMVKFFKKKNVLKEDNIWTYQDDNIEMVYCSYLEQLFSLVVQATHEFKGKGH